jgi:hypothetical protein
MTASGSSLRGRREQKAGEDRKQYEERKTTSHLEIINDVRTVRQWRILLRRLIRKGVS